MLPTDSKARKALPMYSGVRKYFPLALAALAEHSREGNEQHNPGQPLHWAREKSTDHCDCIDRHLTDYAMGDKKAMRAIAWRAMAQLQLDEEERITAELQTAERLRNGTGTIKPESMATKSCSDLPQSDPGDEDPPYDASKRWTCPICLSSFSKSDDLRSHRRAYGHYV